MRAKSFSTSQRVACSVHWLVKSHLSGNPTSMRFELIAQYQMAQGLVVESGVTLVKACSEGATRAYFTCTFLLRVILLVFLKPLRLISLIIINYFLTFTRKRLSGSTVLHNSVALSWDCCFWSYDCSLESLWMLSFIV